MIAAVLVPIVLCVDDDRNVLRALSRQLWDEPYHVITLAEPEAALAWAKDSEVRVLVTDQRMAVMTGTELLAAVAAERPDIRSIVLTAYPDEQLARMVRDRKVDGLVIKPWSGDDLKRRIRALL